MLDFSNPWKITETNFDPNTLGKVEANFCLGNGYLGLRSATEEKYLNETQRLVGSRHFQPILSRGGHGAAQCRRCDQH